MSAATATAPSEPDLTLLLSQSVAMLKANPVEAKRRFRLTAAEHADRTMSEKTLYQRVRYRAKKHKWRFVHFTQAMAGGADGRAGAWKTPVGGDATGFPDLILAKAGHPLAFVELKRELGKVAPAQAEWISLLRDIGHPVFVWRPSDLRLGVIDGYLKGLTNA